MLTRLVLFIKTSCNGLKRRTTQTRSFEYDALGRLTSTSRNTTSEAYQYDASGNRTQFTVGSHGTTHLVASQNTGGQFQNTGGQF